MVTIDLYKNLSEPDVLGKNTIYIATIKGNFRNGTSIINPVIDIERNEDIIISFDIVYGDNNLVVAEDEDDISVTIGSYTFNDFNYVYIRELRRYYFIVNVTLALNNYFMLNCSVDTLESNAEPLSDMYALVERNEFRFDNYIEDNKMPYEFYNEVNEYDITNRSYIDFSYKIADGCFAISFINDQKNHVNAQVTGVDCLPSVYNSQIGSHIFNQYGIIDGFDVIELASELYDDESQLSFITSLISFPFEIPHSNTYTRSLQLGSTVYNSIYVHFLQNGYNTISPYYLVGSIDFNDYATHSYMDYEPYSKYEVYLPFYDYVELKSADIRDSIIDIYYSFDFTNGCGKVNIINRTKEYVIKSVEFNVGVKIAVNRNNLQQLSDERTQMAIKGTLATIGSASALIGGVVTGNPLMAVGGAIGLGSSIGNIAGQLATQHEKATASNSGGINGVYSSRDVKLKITRYVKKEPDDYAHYYGRPLNETIQLGNIHGYTLIKDIHLNDLNITKTEIDMLYNILTNGIVKN